MSQETVYLDNGATTKVDEEVARVALEAMTHAYGNPSSSHRLGVEAARLITLARERVARALSASLDEITFTSGGTESNALGLLGAARATRARGVVVTELDHPSITDAARRLGEEGFAIACVKPNRRGLLEAEALLAAVTTDTAVCSLIWVQNELGTVQPIEALCRVIRARAPRCHIHVDGVQAIGKLAIDLTAAPFDSLALSGHKLHAPKGVGALWLKKGRRVQPLTFGGGQEKGVRPGTEGVPGIAALGLAVELAEHARPVAVARMTALRERLWAGIASSLPDAVRHIDPQICAPHLLSVGFPHTAPEPLLHALEARGVYASAGSACHAKERRPSPALQAIGVPDHMGTLRFSLSRLTTEPEIDRAIQELAPARAEIIGPIGPPRSRAGRAGQHQ